MEQLVWILWIVLGVTLIIAEIFTFGFVLFCFGVGALAAGLFGALGFGFAFQFLIFAIVSIILTIMSRTIFAKYFSHGDQLKMGVDALPGQIGTVTNSSQGSLHEGAVKVYGSTWTAFPVDGEMPLLEGEKVEVVRVQGSSIYVQKIDSAKKLPDWREEE